MIDELKKQYSEFTIKELSTGWIEVITPFLDTHNDFISVYIKDNIIADDEDTLDDVSEYIKEHVVYYIQEESQYWNFDLDYKNNEIFVKNFTYDRLMPFIQLLIKIHGIIEYEQLQGN